LREVSHTKPEGWVTTLRAMATRSVEKEENDPTGEEPALEYDGTKTDQLDDTYRILVASTSEGWNVESDAAEMSPTAADNETFDMPRPVDDEVLGSAEKAPAYVPTMIDKTDGYNPYDTIIDAGLPKGFVTKPQRNVKPR
jgi:hypothetical protein